MMVSVTRNKALASRFVKISLSLLCIIVGGMIYLGYRPTNLLMFQWVDVFHLNHLLANLRATASSIFLPEELIYNFPSFLWLFAYMYLIDAIWGKEKNKEYIVYLYSVPIFAILTELLQLFGILCGTFDIMDIVGYIGAVTIFEILKKLDR